MSAELVGQIIEGLEPGAFVTKFVLIAEVIDTDGERGIWTETHYGAKPWDTLGLLTYSIECLDLCEEPSDDDD